jgi:hypothetical protein
MPIQITSKTKPKTGSFLPISPNPKEKYPMQIQIDYRYELYCADGSRAPQAVQLPKKSFLRIDEHYEVPLASLRPYLDVDGDQLKIRGKRKGGLGDLKDYLRKNQWELQGLQENLLKQISGLSLQTTNDVRIETHVLAGAVNSEQPTIVHRQEETPDAAVEDELQASTTVASIEIGTSEHVVPEPCTMVVVEPTAIVSGVADEDDDEEESWDIIPIFEEAKIVRDFVRWVCEDSNVDRATMQEKCDLYCLHKFAGTM